MPTQLAVFIFFFNSGFTTVLQYFYGLFFFLSVGSENSKCFRS